VAIDHCGRHAFPLPTGLEGAQASGGTNRRTVRITETFIAAAPPEVLFDYMTDPSNLAKWQTSKTLVEPLTEGPTRLGTQVRERTKPPGGKEFEQVVEFIEFDRPRRFHVHIVEGPSPIDGTWTLKPRGPAPR
jgi:uncharacterized protein YndB with AHSA1/START domain